MSYWGASRCHPMGLPGRYSLIRAMANAPGSTPAQWAIVARNGNRNAGIGPAAARSVRLAEERHSPPSDDTAQREIRERNIGDRFEEDSLIRFRDEVLAIVEAWGHIALEETWRSGHDPSVPWVTSRETPVCGGRRVQGACTHPLRSKPRIVGNRDQCDTHTLSHVRDVRESAPYEPSVSLHGGSISKNSLPFMADGGTPNIASDVLVR